jgi:hypothetical protein
MKSEREESAVPAIPAIPETAIEAARRFWIRTGERRIMRMIGGSMRPLIREGDRLHIDPRPGRLCLGDVLIYRHQGKFIAHRFIALRKSGREAQEAQLMLKGDAVPRSDPPLLREQIIGRVAGVEGVEGGSGFADYTSPSWRIRNLLMARLAWTYRLYCAVRRRAGQPIKYLLHR